MENIATNAQKCFEVMLSLQKQNIWTPETKKEYYINKNYLKQNIELFSFKQLNELMSYPIFPNNLLSLAPILIKKAIENEKSLNNLPLPWMTHKKVKGLLSEYFQVVNKENNEEQLKLFIHADLPLVKRYIYSSKYKSAILIELLVYDDINLVDRLEASDSKKFELFKHHYANSKNILFYMNKFPKSIENKVIHFIALDMISKIEIFNNKNLLPENNRYYSLFSYFQLKLLREMEKIDKNIYERIMNKNFVNILFENMNQSPLTDYLIENYRSNIIRTKTKNINQFEFKYSYVENLLRNDRIQEAEKLTNFIDTFPENEQEMLIAMGFSYTIKKNAISPLIQNASFEKFEKYYLKTKSQIPDQIKKEVESIYLHKKLSENIAENSTKVRRNKI